MTEIEAIDLAKAYVLRLGMGPLAESGARYVPAQGQVGPDGGGAPDRPAWLRGQAHWRVSFGSDGPGDGRPRSPRSIVLVFRRGMR